MLWREGASLVPSFLAQGTLRTQRTPELAGPSALPPRPLPTGQQLQCRKV